MALHMLTDQMREEQVEWSLAVALTAMSDAALNGLSPGRTQAVADHLALIADNEAMTLPLRNACDKLVDLWENIHVR
jgi:hypothetical protein